MRIYDVSNCLFYTNKSSYYIYGDIEITSEGAFKKKINVGGVVNLLTKLYNSNEQTFFCFDSQDSIKQQKYPIYKSTRNSNKHKSDTQLQSQILYYIVNEISSSALKKDGYEADDLIYYILEKYKDEKTTRTIFTNDKDLYVHIDSNTRVANNLDINNIICNLSQGIVTNRYTIPYKYLNIWKVLVGDISDNIPRLVQTNLAYSIFNETIKLLDTDGEKNKKYVRAMLAPSIKNKELLHRNVFLVYPLSLSHDDTLESKEGKVINKEKLKEYIRVLKEIDRSSELYQKILDVCQ